MADDNQNNNNQQNQNSTADGNNNNNKQSQNNNQNNNNQQVDVKKIESDAIANLFKELGVDSEEALKGIITKHNETENANKTDLQRMQGALDATTKELVAEKNARILAEAKLSAIKLGAKTALVDDLVTVAMSKVTKDKDINAIMAEIKAGATGSVYFEPEEDENANKNKNITNNRASQQNKNNNNNGQNQNSQQNNNNTGGVAERLMARRKAVKKTYFEN